MYGRLPIEEGTTNSTKAFRSSRDRASPFFTVNWPCSGSFGDKLCLKNTKGCSSSRTRAQLRRTLWVLMTLRQCKYDSTGIYFDCTVLALESSREKYTREETKSVMSYIGPGDKITTRINPTASAVPSSARERENVKQSVTCGDPGGKKRLRS